MEMNTRLQVEHPVTEEITGVDLVEWQLRVASGEPLPKRQDELSINGWAMEARLYAEDPAKGFLPSVGRLDYLLFQDIGRVETGVDEGDTISTFYDPMVAKLVARGDDRRTAIELLSNMASSVEIWPVRTNAGFLARAIQSEDFTLGNLDTGFIARHGDVLVPSNEPNELVWGTAATFALQRVRDEDEGLAGLRLNAARRLSVALTFQSKTRTLTDDLVLADATGYTDSERILVFDRGTTFEFGISTRGSYAGVVAGDGTILSPMPGKIIAVDVTPGQTVTKGQKLVTLEAMKMEHSLTAPFDGTIAELNAETGGQVSEGMLLVRIEPAAEPG